MRNCCSAFYSNDGNLDVTDGPIDTAAVAQAIIARERNIRADIHRASDKPECCITAFNAALSVFLCIMNVISIGVIKQVGCDSVYDKKCSQNNIFLNESHSNSSNNSSASNIYILLSIALGIALVILSFFQAQLLYLAGRPFGEAIKNVPTKPNFRRQKIKEALPFSIFGLTFLITPIILSWVGPMSQVRGDAFYAGIESCINRSCLNFNRDRNTVGKNSTENWLSAACILLIAYGLHSFKRGTNFGEKLAKSWQREEKARTFLNNNNNQLIQIELQQTPSPSTLSH